ncbi:MAG: translocation/assembly module TamB domain-containing protein, partial [Flavobacteriaceae bacterium]
RLKALNWDRFALSGQVDYSLGKSLEGQVQMQIEEGTIATTFDFKKTTNDWNFSQKFSYTNFPLGRLSSIEALKQLDGTAEIAGSLINKNIHQLDWNINVDRLEWEHLLFKNFAVVGTVDQKGQVISGIVNDEKISAAFEVTQLKNKTKDFAFISQLSNVNLSALGWTPVDSDVRLKALVSLNGSDYNVSKIGFSGMSIMNNKGTTAFNDFLVVLSSNSGINQIKQIGSDFFDLSLRGRFSYRNMLAIAQSAFEEALLIPRQAPVRKQESFEFNLILQERLLKALYPDLISPENINLGGKISSLSGESSFSVFLPFLTYKGYRFEALSLETTSNNPEVLARFKADKIYWDKGQLSEIALVTKNQKGNLNAQLNGKFGKSGQNSFGLDFSYKQAATKSIFSVARTTLLLGGEQWVLKEGNLPSLVYDTANQQLSLLDFSVKTNQQSLSTDFQYTSINDFSLKVKTENLKLNPILPEGDKFNFWGTLNSEVTIVQNDQQTSASIAIGLDDLEINKVYLGDLSFNVEGNPQFKTYTVSTQLEKDNSITLKGSGNIYIPNQLPNLNIDLELQDFDISFLSSLGKTKITNSTGNLTGDLNLWGDFKDLKLAGNTVLNEGGFFIPSINARYELAESTNVIFRDRTIDFINANVQESSSLTQGILNGNLSHFNFSAWEMDMELNTERLLVYNRSEQPEYLFHGQGFLKGKANFTGPTKALTLKVIGSSSEGTTLVIPWRDSKGLTDTSFIDFLSKGKDKQSKITTEISEFDKAFRGFEMIFELDINRNAEVEIVVDQSSGSTLSGRGAGNILIESNTDGKFNIWGDFITYDGIYNFKNTGLIDKKFKVNQGGTIVWEGDPLEAQLNIEATYQVPGGANPALLVDNPNFNRKIPTNVKIQLMGNLIKPDDPIFDISFPNTTGIVASEINYRLADQERRQLQAISLLSQGIFISEVSVSLQGITNNLYQKASDVFSTLLGTNDGKLNVGLNYLQGEENPAIDLRTEDRVGLTLSTQISDRILINGKIGVPIDGLEETVIVGDVQIDFILNENGNLKAKVFNRENEFRYLGDEFGYTQGMGMSYQVDFNTFQELIKKIQKRASPQVELPDNKSISGMIEYIDKGN